MKVVVFNDTISVDDVMEKLKKGIGILVWIGKHEPYLKFIKGECSMVMSNAFEMGWASLYFERVNDRSRIDKPLRDVIIDAINRGDDFYWFEDEMDFIRHINDIADRVKGAMRNNN